MVNQELRVWWASSVGMLHIEVKTVEEAQIVLNALAQRDLSLGELIGWNSGGLEIYENGEWTEWYNENGDDIDYLMEQNSD